MTTPRQTEDRRKLTEKLVNEATKHFIDEGRLIEAGFAALRAGYIPDNASEIQIREMRIAFMAGAQHLYASIMLVLEPGEEPTEKDLSRMELINAELERFSDEMKMAASPKG